jgi:hypothetical protein
VPSDRVLVLAAIPVVQGQNAFDTRGPIWKFFLFLGRI